MAGHIERMTRNETRTLLRKSHGKRPLGRTILKYIWSEWSMFVLIVANAEFIGWILHTAEVTPSTLQIGTSIRGRWGYESTQPQHQIRLL